MQRAYGVYRDSFGRPVNAATVTVYVAGTSTLASIYQATGDPTSPASQTNPFTTDATGFWEFAAPNGRYDIVIESNSVATQRMPNVNLSDAVAGLVNPMTQQGQVIAGGVSGAPTAVSANSTATPMYLYEVSGGLPSFKQVAATEISGLAAFIVANSVSSFNGRQGAVLPLTNDYTFAQIGSKPTTIAGYGITDTLTNTFNGRSGAVVPAANDYSFSQLSGSASAAQIATALTTPGPIGGTTPSTIKGTTITATTQFSGPGTGLTGTAASLSIGGNAATATNSAQLGGVAASSYALLASPALTGTPTAPTAMAGTNTTQVATTAFVTNAVSSVSGGPYNRIQNGQFLVGLGVWASGGTTAPTWQAGLSSTGTATGSAGLVNYAAFSNTTTSTGSIAQTVYASAAAGNITFSTYQKVTSGAASSSGYVKVYVTNPSTGNETLAGTITLSASNSTTGAWTSRSISLSSTITGAGVWGIRLEIQNVNDFSAGVSGSNTATLAVDDVVLTI